MQLQDIRAVITGGASGLGLAVAQTLIASNAQVVLFDVNGDAGEAAARSLGANAHFHSVDVTKEAAVDLGIEAAHKQMGGLNLAVNCAGVAWPRRIVNK